MKKFAILFYLIIIIRFNASSQTIKQTFVNHINKPYLKSQGDATILIVNNKPFIMLAGQLHNSSASSISYMKPIWDQLVKKHLNTVIVPISWQLIEDQKDRFDFSITDNLITEARKRGLHLVLLWFGSWKNSASTYVPSWIKKNFHQYPYTKDRSGETLEILSPFGEATREADANAFRRLMAHIKEIDEKYQTVIMIQVENDVGVLRSNRDYGDDATKAFNGDIPDDLSRYLVINKNNLAPDLYNAWKANGFKTKGNWETIFGKSTYDSNDSNQLSSYTEELFMAYYYAKYIGVVAASGKSAYDIPMYVNARLQQPDTTVVGKYPNGGPLPEVIDMYKCAAPAINFIAPEIFTSQFATAIDQFHKNGNPLMIPATSGGALGAARAFYVFGEYDAMCFSPFGIDNGLNDSYISNAYIVLNQLKEVILENQGKHSMRGVLINNSNKMQQINLGGYNIEVRLADNAKNSEVAAIIINTAPDEYIIAGKAVDILFSPEVPGEFPHDAIDCANEVTFKNGQWIVGRKLNGDEVNTSIFSGTGLKFPSKSYSIQFVRLYRYR